MENNINYDRLDELREIAFKLSEEEYRNWPLSGELSELESELEVLYCAS